METISEGTLRLIRAVKEEAFKSGRDYESAFTDKVAEFAASRVLDLYVRMHGDKAVSVLESDANALSLSDDSFLRLVGNRMTNVVGRFAIMKDIVGVRNALDNEIVGKENEWPARFGDEICERMSDAAKCQISAMTCTVDVTRLQQVANAPAAPMAAPAAGTPVFAGERNAQSAAMTVSFNQ